MSEILYVTEEKLKLEGFDGAGEEILSYNGKPFTGFIRAYWDDGSPISDTEYKDGYREGAYIEYFDIPFQKHEEYHEKYGVFNGSYKRWNRKGELLYHATWKDRKEVEVHFGNRNNY